MKIKFGQTTLSNKRLFWMIALGLMVMISGIYPEVNATPKTGIGTQFADYIMSEWPNPNTITTKRWEYTNGIILYGMDLLYQSTGNTEYLQYIKKFVDQYVGPNGQMISIRSRHNLDIIQPSNLLFDLYETYRDDRYKLCAINTRNRFNNFPVNREGGFWHKDNYPDQMWLDGQYMALPFITRYGATFATPGADQDFCFRTAVFNLKLIARHTLNPGKKLLYHAWDCSKAAAWANPSTGVSPEFWSRSMGWYAMALVDTLKYLPRTYPGYDDLKDILRTFAEGLKKYQNPVTGLWYQVLDKGERADNWLDTSGSAMFVYALQTAINQGNLDPGYTQVTLKGWSGLETMISFTKDGKPILNQSAPAMGVQTNYAGYVNQTPGDNTPHGMAALMMAASVVEY